MGRLISSTVPVGTILKLAGTTVPAGYLACDGTNTYSQIGIYSSLYLALGGAASPYGVNQGGASTFTMPDFRGRSPVGDGAGAGLTLRTCGDKTGTETVILSTPQIPSHTHPGKTDGQNQTHTHTGAAYNGGQIFDSGSANSAAAPDTTTSGANNRDHTHTFTTDGTGGGGAHNNMQPFLVVKFAIKY